MFSKYLIIYSAKKKNQCIYLKRLCFVLFCFVLFRTLALLTFWTVDVWACPVLCRAFSSIPGLSPLDAGSRTHPSSSSWNNQICLLKFKCPPSPPLIITKVRWRGTQLRSLPFTSSNLIDGCLDYAF